MQKRVLFQLKITETSAQPERIFPLENCPRAILENMLGDADHLGAGKVFGEHFAYRRASLHRLPNDLMIDGSPTLLPPPRAGEVVGWGKWPSPLDRHG